MEIPCTDESACLSRYAVGVFDCLSFANSRIRVGGETEIKKPKINALTSPTRTMGLPFCKQSGVRLFFSFCHPANNNTNKFGRALFLTRTTTNSGERFFLLVQQPNLGEHFSCFDKNNKFGRAFFLLVFRQQQQIWASLFLFFDNNKFGRAFFLFRQQQQQIRASLFLVSTTTNLG